jgi:exoribonuclease R
MFKVIIKKRDYSEFEIEKFPDSLPNLSFHPFEYKLFSGDVFCLDSHSQKVNILSSPIKSIKDIPGVLIIHGNTTYGTQNDKFFYKCIPFDKSLPCFLIPYKMKTMDFSKVFQNMYITFTFREWYGKMKHPHGLISQIIGDVSDIKNYYIYQLYCRNLNISIQPFYKKTISQLVHHADLISKIRDNNPDIRFVSESSSSPSSPIFSIDPKGSRDFDDAFRISPNPQGEGHQISIYISNVPLIMDTLGLWEYFSPRVATIYLPNENKPMLPSILSDSICSLLEHQHKVAFVLEAIILKGQVISIEFSNQVIKLNRNYVYDTEELESNVFYQQLFGVVREMNKKYPYLREREEVKNSHEVVEYLMLFMNHQVAKRLYSKKQGILREMTRSASSIDIDANGIPAEIETFVKCWGGSSSYVDASTASETGSIGHGHGHSLLGLDVYTQITSPIRRLVDLLNMIKFQQLFIPSTRFTQHANLFFETWINKLEFINASMKNIQKVQRDCKLLAMCTFDPNIVNTIYYGYVIEIGRKTPNKYIVYIPSLQITSGVLSIEKPLEIFKSYSFRLFLFDDEENLQRKIRFQLID